MNRSTSRRLLTMGAAVVAVGVAAGSVSASAVDADRTLPGNNGTFTVVVTGVPVYFTSVATKKSCDSAANGSARATFNKSVTVRVTGAPASTPITVTVGNVGGYTATETSSASGAVNFLVPKGGSHGFTCADATGRR